MENTLNNLVKHFLSTAKNCKNKPSKEVWDYKYNTGQSDGLEYAAFQLWAMLNPDGTLVEWERVKK